MTYFQCDITNENKVEAVFDQISQKFGGVDILISNAGFAIQSSLDKLTKKQLDSSFDLNFLLIIILQNMELKL